MNRQMGLGDSALSRCSRGRGKEKLALRGKSFTGRVQKRRRVRFSLVRKGEGKGNDAGDGGIQMKQQY